MVRILSFGALLLSYPVGCGSELVTIEEVQAEKHPLAEDVDKGKGDRKPPQKKQILKARVDRNDPEERFPVSASRENSNRADIRGRKESSLHLE